jgi:hypothetical protein
MVTRCCALTKNGKADAIAAINIVFIQYRIAEFIIGFIGMYLAYFQETCSKILYMYLST